MIIFVNAGGGGGGGGGGSFMDDTFYARCKARNFLFLEYQVLLLGLSPHEPPLLTSRSISNV